MTQPILVLQYPDRYLGRTVALASTKDWEAMQSFKRAALADAKLDVMRRGCDDVLRVNAELEVERLEALLGELIPDDVSDEWKGA